MTTRFKTKVLLLVALLFATGSMYAQKKKASKKPNIILIFADDISARELPIYGSTEWSKPEGGTTTDKKYRASTPVLDRLANEGCWVENAWAATVCSPSRAMMMTGRYAHLHKWWMNGDYGRYTDHSSKRPKKKIWELYRSSPLLIGHVAQQGGYATYWAGKTQMKGADVRKFGFDEGVLTPGEQGAEQNPYTDFKISQRGKGKNKKLYNDDTQEVLARKSYAQSGWYWQPHVRLMNHPKASKSLEWWPNTEKTKQNYGLETYAPDVELDFIFEFMDRKHKEDKPFFIYHTTHLGHDAFDFFNPDSKSKWPGTPKVKWNGKKYTRTTPKVTGDKGKYNTHGTITEPGIHNHINYLDYQVWLYLKKLKKMGIEDNTILIFCADNGTSGYGKVSPDRQKGTHVPLIVYAPGMNMTKKGKQDILVNMSDMLPTIADITGTKIPKNYEINGESLLPYLTTSKDKHRDWIYAYHKDKQIIRGHKVLMDGKGKWWDVEETPDNLIDFPQIKDWKKATKEQKAEKKMLQSILPRFNNYKEAHDAPADQNIR